MLSLLPLADRLVRSLAAAAGRIALRHRQRQTALALSGLDDRALYDIGLNRTLIMSASLGSAAEPRRDEPAMAKQPSRGWWRSRLSRTDELDAVESLGPSQAKEVAQALGRSP
jgi:uncharacterized protein YjiS (DUF1127 family)